MSDITNMKQLPNTKNTLVLRTDFSDEKKWDEICKIIKAPVKIDSNTEFKAYIDIISELEFGGLKQDQVLPLLPKNNNHMIMFVVDSTTVTTPGYPLLCIDLAGGKGKYFRVAAAAIQGVENNLSIGNLDFDELAELVDEQGIFHGIDF